MTFLLAGAALGLAGSVHCAGMCGPLLLAVHGGLPRAQMMRRMALYHAARVFMYALIGIPTGYAARALSFGVFGRTVAMTAGMLLVAAALLALTERLGAHGETEPRRHGAHGDAIHRSGAAVMRFGRGLSQAWSSAVIRIAARAAALTRGHPHSGYVVLGAINGLLPCGLVYAAVAAAAASGTIAAAVTFMIGFGAGTVPLLLAVTLSAAAVPATLRQRLRFVAPALMALAGVLLIVRAFAPVEHTPHSPPPFPSGSIISPGVVDMSSAFRRRIAAVVVCLAAMTAISAVVAAAAATNRTVYVSVTDGKGNPLTDLTTANFKVKEGGKDREIIRAEPAKAPAHIALMVEDRLSVDQSVRVGLFEFVKRMAGNAEISLITVALRNNEVTPFTSDPNIVLRAINDLSRNANPTSNLTEGINDISKKLDQENPTRPIVVVVAMSGGQAGAEPKSVLNQLRQSGATLYAVTFGNASDSQNPMLGTMGDESGREQVIGDGAKQSGGRRFDVVTTGAIPKALQDIASDIMSQYAITYALPEGVKPDKRFSITTDRKGVSLRAPSAIPDK